MKLRVIESEIEPPKGIIDGVLSTIKNVLQPGVIEQEKKALKTFADTLNDRLNDIHNLSQDFG